MKPNNNSLRARGRLRLVSAALVLAGAAALTGCVASVGAEADLVYGYRSVYVDTVPVEIEMYPHVYYRGRYAYLVDDRWYYPTGSGWVIFRDEPVELGRYRTTIRSRPRYVEPRRIYPPRRVVPREPESPRERPRTRTPR